MEAGCAHRNVRRRSIYVVGVRSFWMTRLRLSMNEGRTSDDDAEPTNDHAELMNGHAELKFRATVSHGDRDGRAAGSMSDRRPANERRLRRRGCRPANRPDARASSAAAIPGAARAGR